MNQIETHYKNHLTLSVYWGVRAALVIAALFLLARGTWEPAGSTVLILILMLIPSILKERYRFFLPFALDLGISIFVFLTLFLCLLFPLSLSLSLFLIFSLSLPLSPSLPLSHSLTHSHIIILIFSISYSLSLYLFSSLHFLLRISDRGHSERRMRRASDSKINPKHNGNFESDDETN